MPRRLVPKPHMLKSIRSRHWHLSGAIEELVDNAADHGRATRVTVYIDNANGIIVRDDGVGMDDINRLFCYGDAGAYDALNNIGQYGVGAYHAAVWLGDVLTVETIHAGRRHAMSVDWSEVERTEWPEAYTGSGRAAKSGEIGTTVSIQKLTRHFQLKTSEGMAEEFGRVFAPGLRRGLKIFIHHALSRGDAHTLDVVAFNPALTELSVINGEVSTERGPLRWVGRAGLCQTLTERTGGVHIAFRHRVIEQTFDPFFGASAPTLYVEVDLDDSTPWKFQLSDHKDKVVRHREELMDGIHAAIKRLLELSAKQSQFLALNAMIAPIETSLNRALKGAGLLFVDPNEEPDGGSHGDGPGPVKPGNRLQTPQDEGEPAKEIPRPRGINFDWRTQAELRGRAYDWHFSGPMMTILLDADLFKPVIDWPPSSQNEHLTKQIVGFLSAAIENQYLVNSRDMRGVLTPKLIKQIEEWSATNHVAPYLYRTIITQMH